MSALLALTGLVLLCLPGLRWLPSRRLHPAEWAHAAAGALRVGHATVRLGLLLGAAPTVLRAAGIEDAAAACHRMFGPVAPGGTLIGWSSAAAFAWLTITRRWARRSQRDGFDRVHVEAWIGEHHCRDGIDLVALPIDQPFAYSVPRGPGQIVFSDSLRAALDPAELEAVLAHEASHLRHHHARFLADASAVDVSFGRVPPMRASSDSLRLAVERWADEDAAPTAHQREVVRNALAKTTETMLRPALAFTTTLTVLDRLAALNDHPPSPSRSTRVAALAPLGLLTAAIVVVLSAWATQTHHGLLGIIGFCLT